MLLKKLQAYEKNDTQIHIPGRYIYFYQLLITTSCMLNVKIQLNIFLGYVVHENPEEKIAQAIKSILSKKTDKDITSIIEENLQTLRLYKNNKWTHPQFEAQLNHILHPKNLSLQEALVKLVESIAENAGKNKYLHNFLQEVQLSDANTLFEYVKLEGSIVLPKVVTYAYVLENLNQKMIKDWKFLETCFKVWSPFLAEVRKLAKQLEEFDEFEIIKMNSIEYKVEQYYLKFFKQNNVDEEIGPHTSFNIFQAVVSDVLEKHMDNALAGKTLALNRPGLKENNQTMAGPTKFSKTSQQIEFSPPLPEKWADLYMTWNMAFVSRYTDWPYFMVKLLIPSVSGYHDNPNGYLYSRVLALFSHIVNSLMVRSMGGSSINWKIEALALSWGRSNRKSAEDYKRQLLKATAEVAYFDSEKSIVEKPIFEHR